MQALIAVFMLLGVCCGSSSSSSSSTLNSEFDDLSMNYNQIKRLIASFSNENLIKAVNFGTESTERSRTLEHRISLKVRVINGTISHAQLIDSLPDQDAKNIDNIAQDILKASSYLLHSYCRSSDISNKDCVKFMTQYQLPETLLRDRCVKEIGKSKYHSYRRLLPANYKDGIQKFRLSVTGKELPSAREISNLFYTSGIESVRQHNEHKLTEINNEGIVDKKLSLSVAQWTQFFEQDLSKTVVRSMENNSPIECCDQDSVHIQPRYLHPSCHPIYIQSNDPFYGPLRVTCLNYVRSALSLNEQCKFGGAEQLNQATNKFDLSQLYGIDETQLRSFHQGLLITSNDNNLPTTNDENCIRFNETTFPCYYSGDSRVNVNPYVTILYTVFLRSHNHIAHKLKRMNPTWNDSKLFKMSKKINTAIYQKIIYTDWANAVLGKKLATEIRSKNLENHDARKYKNDKISNEFATAAIKFYNTMMPGDLKNNQQEENKSAALRKFDNVIEAVGPSFSQRNELLKLQDVFYKPKDLSKNNFLEQVTNALLKQNAMALDSSYVDDLSLQLFRAKMPGNKLFGADSLAFDIQRSRDHGLQSYVNYIKKCQNIKITKWEDLRNIVREDDLNRLKSIYSSYEDIDLIVGGLCEIPAENATVGATFSCILSEQLISTKLSDHKFYDRTTEEHDDKIKRTIEEYTATRLLCDTTKLKQIQKNIFLVPSDENPLIDCSNYEELPKLDLSYWLDH